MRLIVAALIGASCANNDAPYELDFSLRADVRGEANATCVLSLDHANASLTYDVAAPAQTVPDASPISPASLGDCADTHTEQGVVATPADAPALVVGRNLCLDAVPASTFASAALFSKLGLSPDACPGAMLDVTLTCGGVVLYDHAPLNICTRLL